jgi:DNA-nicking Smr family endonuclease
LSREKIDPQEAGKAQKSNLKAPAVPVLPRPAPKPPAPRLKPGTTLDSSWDRKLRAGALEPDRVVDLHGMSLDKAWRAIDRALEQAINRGDRVVLLITGHHRRGDPPVERGKIRAAVHDWLAASRHAHRIAAVRGASRKHGGGGSLYLVLRRR